MNKDNTIALEILEVEKRVAHENQCLVKLRALRMHKVLRREPLKEVDLQIAAHDTVREQFVNQLRGLRAQVADTSRRNRNGGKPQTHTRFRRAEAAKADKRNS
jgi:hypothetical protein